jgi:hypothetical protein
LENIRGSNTGDKYESPVRKDSIEMDLREIRCKNGDKIHLEQKASCGY